MTCNLSSLLSYHFVIIVSASSVIIGLDPIISLIVRDFCVGVQE